MKVTETKLAGLLVIQPTILTDNRGYFFEASQETRYGQYHIPAFVQQNVSRSKMNVIRGLHYQQPNAQGKLVGVTHGTVWDVVVDIRRTSPTFGKWLGITLSDENHTQLYIPPGFAHGFCTLSDTADFYYLCTDYYNANSEHGIAWNDPTINIEWPTQQPILSAKDEAYSFLDQIEHDKLFA